MGWLRMAGWALVLGGVGACGGITRHSGPGEGPDSFGGSSFGGTNSVGGGGYASGGFPAGTTGCTYQGNIYPNGSRVTAAGCTCTCNGGEIVCAALPCDLKTCQYAGIVYEPGDTFTASDGCNICTCEDDGNIACTSTDCPESQQCLDLEQNYSVFLDAATRCMSDVECTTAVPRSVRCSCPMTWVSTRNSKDTQLAEQAKNQFERLGCLQNTACPTSCGPLPDSRCIAGRCGGASGIK